MTEIYYSPNGYWKGYNAIDKLAKAGGVSKQEAREFLRIQPIWQIYLPAPTYIPRPKFDVYKPNEVHQADLLYLPHDSVKKKTFKYALTVVDVASRYKEAEPLSTKTSMEVAEALQRIYKRGPLRFPSLLQVDPGREFKGEVIHLAARKKMNIRWGRVNIHRDQGIVERFNRSLAERLFGYQYAEEMKNPGVRNVEWVQRLPEVLKAMNNEVTRLTGVKPVLAIKRKIVNASPSAPAGIHRPVGDEERILPHGVTVRHLYAPGEQEGGNTRRATDPIWSVDTFAIKKSIRKDGEPIVYYLQSERPKRGFVREELQIVPSETVLAL